LSIPVILPEAVSLHEEAIVNVLSPAQLVGVAVAVVDSSSFLHDPMSTTMPTINTIQNSNFFIITSSIIEKCKIIPTFMYRVWR
jgi:hypothetical protein